MFTVMKEANLEGHNSWKHGAKLDELQGQMSWKKKLLLGGHWVPNRQLSQDHILTETMLRRQILW